MRTLKFRTWSKTAQQMISWEELKPKFIKLLDNEEYPFMQFTGLLDKNGKEIYENDRMESELYGVGFVEWDNDNSTFHVRVPEGEENIPEYYFVKGFGEVIGNIHEVN